MTLITLAAVGILRFLYLQEKNNVWRNMRAYILATNVVFIVQTLII